MIALDPMIETTVAGRDIDPWPFHAPVVHRDGITGMPGPVHVHGVGVLEGVLIHATRPPAARPASAELGMSLRGVVTLYIGREAILPDPLGASLTYIWERGRDWAISSDLKALVWWLGRRGIHPPKSTLFGTLLVANGFGAFDLTSYQGIRALPALHYIAIEGARFRERAYPLDDYLSHDVSYGEALDEVEADITANVWAVATAGFPNVIAHLTGGFDSRLVTAACLRNGLHFVSFCSGPLASADKRVAQGICRTLGLPMTHSGGYAETATAPSLEARLLDEMNAVSGMSQLVRTGSSVQGQADTIVLSGGFGERLRSLFSVRGDEPLEVIARDLLGAPAVPMGNERSILAGGPRTVLLSLLEEVLGACQSSWENPIDRYRMRHFQRYTIGLTSRRVSEFVPRFDPLYSVAAVRLSLVAGNEALDSRRIIFDLMQRFDERLVGLPFGNGAWPPTLQPPPLRPFVKGTPVYVDEPVAPLPLWSGAKPVSARERETIAATGAAAWQVADLAATQALCRVAIGRTPELARLFDRRMLNRLIERPPAHRGHLRLLHQLTSTLVWFGDETARK